MDRQNRNKQATTRQDALPPEAMAVTDLSWTAFCYAANELDAQAHEAFQQRLACDPAAQQALVDAVAQASLLEASFAAGQAGPQSALTPLTSVPAVTRSLHEPTTRSRRFLKTAGWVVSIAAAILVTTTLLNRVGPPTSTPQLLVMGDELLAEAWGDGAVATDLPFAHELSESQLFEIEFFDQFEREDIPEDPALEIAESTEFENAEVDWMFVALQEMQAESLQ